jgi:hypothetical protein
MADLGEKPTLLDERALAVSRRLSGEELERDLAIEAGVPRAEHFAKGAGTDASKDAEMTPAVECGGTLSRMSG